MTKMRMKSPAFSTLKLIQRIKTFLKKMLNIHTDRTEGNWMNSTGRAGEMGLVGFSRQLSRQKGGEGDGLRPLAFQVRGWPAAAMCSCLRTIYLWSFHKSLQAEGQMLYFLQRNAEAQEKAIISPGS